MKILLPVDGLPSSDSAVEQFSKQPWPRDSEVKVINAVEIPIKLGGGETWIPSPGYHAEVDRSFRRVAGAIIDNATTKLETSDAKTLKITSEIIQGPARQVIVEESERWEQT